MFSKCQRSFLHKLVVFVDYTIDYTVMLWRLEILKIHNDWLFTIFAKNEEKRLMTSRGIFQIHHIIIIQSEEQINVRYQYMHSSAKMALLEHLGICEMKWLFHGNLSLNGIVIDMVDRDWMGLKTTSLGRLSSPDINFVPKIKMKLNWNG